jgi:hypothetical protein
MRHGQTTNYDLTPLQTGAIYEAEVNAAGEADKLVVKGRSPQT